MDYDTPRLTALRAVLLLVWLLGLIGMALWSLEPPVPRPADAPPDQFSAARALPHVRALAAVSHPLGTSAHNVVCEYIVRQLRGLGVRPQMQTASVVADRWQRPYRAANIRNIWARLPGRSGTGGRAILLVAHYDSVPTGPGASDDAASGAALLETARALLHARAAHGPPLNDIVLLWTDGEEAGLFGARAFVRQSPFPLSPPPLVLNFEARGVSGPSLLFETGPNNGALVREFARAVPQPAASSLFYAVYKILPNDSDFTEFRKAGIGGLNFAFINGVARYHTALDDPAHLDARSLQQQGDIMLHSALRLADHSPAGKSEADADRRGVADVSAASPSAGSDAIYFNVTRATLAIYPETWAIPLAAVATLLTIALWVYGLRCGQWTVRSLGGGVGRAVGAVVLGAMAGLLPMRLFPLLAPSPRSTLYTGNVTLAGTILLALGLMWGLWAWRASADRNAARNTTGADADTFRPDAITGGAMLLWLALTWLTTLKLPGGSYLFVWPLLFALAAAWICLLTARSRSTSIVSGTSGLAPAPHHRTAIFIAQIIVQMASSTSALLLVVPVLCLLFSALSLTALPVVGAFVALCAGLLHTQLVLVSQIWSARPFAMPLARGIAGLVLIGAGAQALRATPAHPQFNSIFYGLDADTGRATWASDDLRPDAWTAQFLGQKPQAGSLPAFLPVSAGRFLQAPAPPLALAPSVATLQNDRIEAGTRILQIHVTSPRDAPIIEIAAPDAEVLEAVVEEQSVGGNQGLHHAWSLLYFSVPAEGITLTLRVALSDAKTPLTLRVVDRSYGLPDIAGHPYTSRPAAMIATPATGWYQDTLLVGKTYRF